MVSPSKKLKDKVVGLRFQFGNRGFVDEPKAFIGQVFPAYAVGRHADNPEWVGQIDDDLVVFEQRFGFFLFQITIDGDERSAFFDFEIPEDAVDQYRLKRLAMKNALGERREVRFLRKRIDGNAE